VYILIVDKEFDDWEEHKVLGRERKWFNLNEAKVELEKHKPMQGTYLNFLKGYENNIKNSYFNNNTNTNSSINDINIILQNNTDNNNGNSEFNTNNMHFNGSLSHQYSLISSLSANNSYHHKTPNAPANIILNSSYSFNSPNASSHLDHDIISGNNTTSLLNSNTI